MQSNTQGDNLLGQPLQIFQYRSRDTNHYEGKAMQLSLMEDHTKPLRCNSRCEYRGFARVSFLL
jgi:hypothetical protein